MRVIARTVRPAARERVAAVDDWPVAVLSIADDRVAGVNGAALTLLRAVDPHPFLGRPLSEVVVVGEPLVRDADGHEVRDAAGTGWRHALARPLSGGSVAVLVARGEVRRMNGVSHR